MSERFNLKTARKSFMVSASRSQRILGGKDGRTSGTPSAGIIKALQISLENTPTSSARPSTSASNAALDQRKIETPITVESSSKEFPRGSVHWKFLSHSHDLLSKQSVVGKWLNTDYIHYADIPSVEMVTHALLWEKEMKLQLAQQRKDQFHSQETESMKKLQSVIARGLLAKRKEAERQEQGKTYLSRLIQILRLEPHERSVAQLEVLLAWMRANCPENAMVFNFLQLATPSECLEFCSGLKYAIFDKNEAILRQNETGHTYFILLTGRASVYINKSLWIGEVANENKKQSSSLGIGDKIDTIHPGSDFGELALLEKVPRSVSILTSGTVESECLIIDKPHFQKCIFIFAKRCADEFITDLRKFHIMANVDEMHLRGIFKRFQRRKLYSGKVLLVQGCEAEDVYLVLHGQLTEWYELTPNEMRNRGETDMLERDDEKSGERGEVQLKDAGIGRIAKQFRRTQLSVMECDHTVIGGYYGLKRIESASTVICKTDCEVICCSATQFTKSSSISMHQRTVNLGKEKHALTVRRIAKYKAMAARLSQTLRAHNTKSKIRRTQYSSDKTECAFSAKDELDPTQATKQSVPRRQSQPFGLYSYIKPKDRVSKSSRSHQRRMRSISLMLHPKDSIQKGVTVDYQTAMKVVTQRESERELVCKTLPKILKEQDPANPKRQLNTYISNKKRIRSASLQNLKCKYGVPTDVWQIDVSHERMLSRSMSSGGLSSERAKGAKRKKKRSLKRSQSASHGKVVNYNQEIIREYQQLIPNTEGRDYARGKRVRSRSGLGMVSGDKDVQGAVSVSVRLRMRSASLMENARMLKQTHREQRSRRRRSQSVGDTMNASTAEWSTDAEMYRDLEYEKLKEEASVLQYEFKLYKHKSATKRVTKRAHVRSKQTPKKLCTKFHFKPKP